MVVFISLIQLHKFANSYSTTDTDTEEKNAGILYYTVISQHMSTMYRPFYRWSSSICGAIQGFQRLSKVKIMKIYTYLQ